MEVLGLVYIPYWLLTLTTVVLLLLMYTLYKQSYFRTLGIPGPTPIPFFGITIDIGKKGLHETDLNLMTKYGRCVGIYLGNIPQLLITEPEMIKQILVKRFQDFTDRPHTLEDTKLMDSAVNLASGEHWKFLRTTLTPAFSTGKMRNTKCLPELETFSYNRKSWRNLRRHYRDKTKTYLYLITHIQMTPLISRCLERLICNGRKMSENGKSVEMKGLFGAFTMDVICSTGFGMDVDSQSNPNDPFVVNATKAMTANLVGPRILLAMMFPDFQRFMRGIPLMDKSALEFFKEATKSVIQERRSNTSNNYRDLIQLMINAHKEQDGNIEEHLESPNIDSYKKRGLTDNEVLANAIIFLLAAFDTTSSLLTFLSYCLAINQEVQDKLRSEINKELGKSQPVYDNVFKLQYLDMVVSETLRIYPPARRFNREARVDTEICGVKIPKGLDVNIPIYSLHLDPEFWPNPHRFDPERFSPENKDSIKPFTFLPFGAGPRNCIGKRLALLQAKMAIVGMVQNFRFQTAPDTLIPPNLDKGAFTKPVDGMFLRLEAL